MNIRKKHILFLLSNLLVMVGLLCLNLHSLAHLTVHQADSHQTNSDSVPIKKMSDDCVLCLVSAFGFADLEVEQLNTVQTETERILFPDFTSLTHQTVSVTAPRAPPPA